MKYFALVLIALSVTLFACKSQKESVNTNEKVSDEVPESLQEFVLLEKHVDSIQRDPFEVHSYSINGDYLEIFVSYGGGCGEADFELYYTQRVMNSMPPQTVVYLGFSDQDPCRAIETKKLSFSLEPFDELAKNGGVWLILGGSDLRQLYKK